MEKKWECLMQGTAFAVFVTASAVIQAEDLSHLPLAETFPVEADDRRSVEAVPATPVPVEPTKNASSPAPAVSKAASEPSQLEKFEAIIRVQDKQIRDLNSVVEQLKSQISQLQVSHEKLSSERQGDQSRELQMPDSQENAQAALSAPNGLVARVELLEQRVSELHSLLPKGLQELAVALESIETQQRAFEGDFKRKLAHIAEQLSVKSETANVQETLHIVVTKMNALEAQIEEEIHNAIQRTEMARQSAPINAAALKDLLDHLADLDQQVTLFSEQISGLEKALDDVRRK